MRLVIDASMALAWLFEREKAEEVGCADRALLAVAEAETFVPPLWHAEVANALLVGERRRVVTEAQLPLFRCRCSWKHIETPTNGSQQ